MSQRKNINLTEGIIWKQMLAFAGPIFVSNLFNQLYNAINSVIVGNYVSAKALSAVSACGSLISIIFMSFYGISQSMGILSSNAYGANEKERLHQIIKTGLIFTAGLSVLLTVLVQIFGSFLLTITHVNADIFEDALVYFKTYAFGYLVNNLYTVNTYLLRALGDSRHTLYYSVGSTLGNIVLGVVFVKYFNWGVRGVALATILSQAIVCVLSFFALSAIDDGKIDFTSFEMDWDITRNILSIGVPIALQNMLLAISGVLVQSYTNQFPNEAIAGVGVAQKVMSFAQMVSNSIAVVVTSFVGQNLGAQKYDRLKKGIKICADVSALLSLLVGIVLYFTADFAVAIFNQNPDVVKYGADMVRYCIIGVIPISYSHIYNAACRGSGNIKVPLFIAIMGQCVGRYMAVWILSKFRFDIRNVYASLLVSQTLSGFLAFLYFRFGRWTKENQLRD